MIFNDEKLIQAIKDAPNASIIRIFYYIAHNQPKDGIFGYRTTKEQLGIDLNLGQAYIFRSLKYLKDNLLIQELKMVDHSDFMANPYFVTNNIDNQDRIKEFTRRVRAEQLKLAEKDRRKAKKASKQ